jgi:hypothetical protein
MPNTAPFWTGESSAAAQVDLISLEMDLMADPEALYLFLFYAGMTHGVSQPGKGSKTQILRALPFTSPDPDNLDAALVGGTQQPFDVTNVAEVQALQFETVQTQVQQRWMKPAADLTEEAKVLAQVDLQRLTSQMIQRHYNEYRDDMVREEYRSHVCTQIFGATLAATAAAMGATSKLSMAVLKEFKRRAALLNIRAFGSQPGTDAQALTGNYVAITDQAGINELEEDTLYSQAVIRDPQDARDSIITGFIRKVDQITVVKSDRMRTQNVGPSGSPLTGHEILFLAGDPQQVDVGENGSQGFTTEFPVAFMQVGLPEVRSNKNDMFATRYIVKWVHIFGAQALQELTSARATTISTLLGATAAPLSSMFIHRGLFV